MHNHNDMVRKTIKLHFREYPKIIDSCRHSLRQLSANFRESPGSPKALMRALFLVVLLIAADDQLQEQMRLSKA
jgi:hypothetical protein